MVNTSVLHGAFVAKQENVSAETSAEPDPDKPMPCPIAQKRADGGETKLDNLVTLCRHHHRAMHEGGFNVQMGTDGVPKFYDRRGRLIPAAPQSRYRGNAFALITANRRAGVDVSAETCSPDWHGERMDDDLVVDSLFRLEG